MTTHTPRRPGTPGPLAAALTLALTFSLPASAGTLLSATVDDRDGQAREFSISGESRRDVVGGEIVFGDERYTISKVSAHGMIGASRDGQTPESG